MLGSLTYVPTFLKLQLVCFSLVAGAYISLGSLPLFLILALVGLTLSCAICLCLFLNIFFLSIIVIIIYVGAIMILFLFIIMMFNLQNKRNYMNVTFTTEIPKQFHIILIVGIFSKIYYHISNILTIFLSNNIYFTNFMIYQYSNIKILLQFFNKDIYIFSTLLYSQFGIILLIIALVMLVAMFGSLFLVLQKYKILL